MKKATTPNTAIFIGRFQPFHNGHLQVIKSILLRHPELHIIIGSAQQSHTQTNPLTIEERQQILTKALKEADLPHHNYTITPLTDINNDDLWIDHLNNKLQKPYDTLYTGRARVKNCFLKHPNPIVIKNLPRFNNLSATTIRRLIKNGQKWQDLVPPATASLLEQWNIADRLKIVQNKQEN